MWVTFCFSEFVFNRNYSGEAELLTEPPQTELNWNKTGCSLISTASHSICSSATKLDAEHSPEGSLQVFLKL